MKKNLFIPFFAVLFFMAGCSAVASRQAIEIPAVEDSSTGGDQTGSGDQTGGGEQVVLPPTNNEAEFLADPKRNLYNLPRAITAWYPVDRAIISVQQTGVATPHVNLTYSQFVNDRNTGVNYDFGGSFDQRLWQFLRKGTARSGLVRYNGTIENGLGDQADPLWGKLFTFVVGQEKVHFAYFKHPGKKGARVYSYDPKTNKLTDYEMFFSTGLPPKTAYRLYTQVKVNGISSVYNSIYIAIRDGQ